MSDDRSGWDEARWRVEADRLTVAGDPRGERIARVFDRLYIDDDDKGGTIGVTRDVLEAVYAGSTSDPVEMWRRHMIASGSNYIDQAAARIGQRLQSQGVPIADGWFCAERGVVVVSWGAPHDRQPRWQMLIPRWRVIFALVGRPEEYALERIRAHQASQDAWRRDAPAAPEGVDSLPPFNREGARDG